MTRMLGLWIVSGLAIGCADPEGRLPGAATNKLVSLPTGDYPCASATDEGADGTIDLRWTYEFDDRGRPVHGDGRYADSAQPDISNDRAWDNLDHLTWWFDDFGPDWQLEYTVVYDTLGTELEDTIAFTTLDGEVVSHLVNLDFDAAGRPARSLETMTGQPDEAVAITYDEFGRVVRWARDRGNDGSIDLTTDVTYDEDARTISSVTMDATATTQYTSVMTFNLDYHPVSRRHTSVEDGEESMSEWLFTWDDDREVNDSYAEDGVVKFIDTYEFECGL